MSGKEPEYKKEEEHQSSKSRAKRRRRVDFFRFFILFFFRLKINGNLNEIGDENNQAAYSQNFCFFVQRKNIKKEAESEKNIIKKAKANEAREWK